MPKERNTLPPVKYLFQCFTYDPDSGELRWKKRRPIWHFTDEHAWKIWNTLFAGKIAGMVDQRGYSHVTINYQRYLTHRVIWKLMEREEPPITIDHRDGNPANNRFSNLRTATETQQMWNRGLRKSNTSGFKGVDRCGSKWRAQIRIPGVKRYQRLFDTAAEAAAAYEAMAREAHGEFYHGAP